MVCFGVSYLNTLQSRCIFDPSVHERVIYTHGLVHAYIQAETPVHICHIWTEYTLRRRHTQNTTQIPKNKFKNLLKKNGYLYFRK